MVRVLLALKSCLLCFTRLPAGHTVKQNIHMVRRYQNQILLGIGFMAVVLVVMSLLTDIDVLLHNLGNFPLYLFPILLALKSFNWLLRVLAWQYFLRVIDIRTVWGTSASQSRTLDQPATIRFQDTFILWLAGLPFAISPGKVAELMKSVILKNMTATPIVHSAPVVLVERLVDGIAIVVMVALPMLIAGNAVFVGAEVDAAYIQGVVFFCVIGLVGSIALMQSRHLFLKMLDRGEQVVVVKKAVPTLRRVYESGYNLTRLRHILPTTILGLVAYTADCWAFYLMLTGFGLDGTWELFLQGAFILSISGILGAMTALPGGAGARELTSVGLLTAILGINVGLAGTLAIMLSIFQLWLGVIVGLIIGVIFRNRLFPPTLDDGFASPFPHPVEESPATA